MNKTWLPSTRDQFSVALTYCFMFLFAVYLFQVILSVMCWGFLCSVSWHSAHRQSPHIYHVRRRQGLTGTVVCVSAFGCFILEHFLCVCLLPCVCMYSILYVHEYFFFSPCMHSGMCCLSCHVLLVNCRRLMGYERQQRELRQVLRCSEGVSCAASPSHSASPLGFWLGAVPR